MAQVAGEHQHSGEATPASVETMAAGRAGSVRSDDVQAITDRLSLRRSASPLEPVHELRGRHVTVVGINYAPEVTGIAPYTTAMAEHLAFSAGSVTVLTGMPHYPHWQVPAEYRWALRRREQVVPESVPGPPIELRRLRHFVPRSQSALKRALYEGTFFLNARALRLRTSPDLIVAVTPSLGGAVAAASLAARHNSKLLVVVQDLMAKAAAQSGMAGGRRVAAATGALEGYALRRADHVAVVSEAFRAPVEQYGVPADRISLLRNWTHISPEKLVPGVARAKLGWPVEPFTVVHTGNIGLKQDLGNMVEAARLLRSEPGVQFVIVGDGSQRAAVQAQAADCPNFRFVDPLDDEQYPLALAAADLLVVNERPGVAEMSLPSKLTSYLCAGRPVLAATEPGGATAAELTRTHGAAVQVPPGDSAALAAQVQKLRADPEERAVMASAGEAYAFGTLGRRSATDRLDEIIRDLLAQP